MKDDPHIQFSIREAARVKKEREDANKAQKSTMEGKTIDDVKKPKENNSIFGTYLSLLQRHPFLVNSIQSASLLYKLVYFVDITNALPPSSTVLQALGIIISQAITSNRKPESLILDYTWINWSEISVMVTLTLVFITPTLLWFYGLLDRAKLGIVATLIVDQFIFSPIFTAAIIAARFYFLDGTKAEDIWITVAPVLPNAIVSAWFFWIPQRSITLSFFPPELHLPFGTVCSLVWNVIFALILSGKN